jgi:tight adherence protein B
MRGKIRAMSMEAKASAVIIGSLPLVVMALTYFSSPDYIMLLFTEPLGNLILVGSAIWMAIGIFVMRQMVNFDF